MRWVGAELSTFDPWPPSLLRWKMLWGQAAETKLSENVIFKVGDLFKDICKPVVEAVVARVAGTAG